MPLTPVNGKSSGWMVFRSRSSTRSMPRRAAALSISPSMTMTICGRETPRYGAVGGLFVAKPRARAAYRETL